MRPGRSVLAALTMLFLSFSAIGFAGSAAAGGPTSVLLVVPGEGRTASLYNGSTEYNKLAELLGAFGASAGSTTPPEGADNTGASGTNDASGPGVTVTWLMHDVHVWRVDQVYLKADGGPIVATHTNQGDEDFLTHPPIWRNLSTDAKELSVLLDSLGVGTSGTGAAATSGGNVSAAASPASSRPATDPSTGTDGWIWGAAGILVGVALSLAVGLGIRHRRSSAAVNDDIGPDPAGPEADPEEPDTEEFAIVNERPMAETLSSHPAGR